MPQKDQTPSYDARVPEPGGRNERVLSDIADPPLKTSVSDKRFEEPAQKPVPVSDKAQTLPATKHVDLPQPKGPEAPHTLKPDQQIETPEVPLQATPLQPTVDTPVDATSRPHALGPLAAPPPVKVQIGEVNIVLSEPLRQAPRPAMNVVRRAPRAHAIPLNTLGEG